MYGDSMVIVIDMLWLYDVFMDVGGINYFKLCDDYVMKLIIKIMWEVLSEI